MNRFEHAVHNARRSHGELSVDAINERWIETQRAMFGDSVTLTDGYRTSAGGPLSPNTLLARLGVDLTDPGFWAAGLEVIANEVGRAEDLAGEVHGG